MRRLISLLLALAALGMASAQTQPPKLRYLYQLGCDGTLDKIDTVSRSKESQVDLATRTGKLATIPRVQGNETFDGCLTYPPLYDAGRHLFYTAVPARAQVNEDGVRGYSILGFSLPELRLVKVISGGKDSEDPPAYRINDQGEVQVGQAVENPSSVLPEQLDLSGYQPAGIVHNTVLEGAGERFLLRIYLPSGAQEFAVADRSAKTVTVSEGLAASLKDVHLTPGGKLVFAEESEASAQGMHRDGKLLIYNAKTGKKSKEIIDQRLKQAYFLAVAPTGWVIYIAQGKYLFFDLGETFAADDAEPIGANRSTSYFFADR